MPSSSEFLNHLPIECRNIIGLAACHQSYFCNRLSIYPGGPSFVDRS
jgi:hypothetical protein